MSIDREQELWAIALHIEKKHGTDGPRYIAEQIGRCVLEGEEGGVVLWKAVAKRFEQLSMP